MSFLDLLVFRNSNQSLAYRNCEQGGQPSSGIFEENVKVKVAINPAYRSQLETNPGNSIRCNMTAPMI